MQTRTPFDVDSTNVNHSDTRILPPPGNFHLMVAGQIVTVLGSQLLRFALSLYVLDTTGRADIFAGLFAISSIPMLLSPIGGAISDRFNRQRLMVLYDAICCAIALSFLFIMHSGSASVFTVGVVMVLLGVVGAVETPNGMAAVPLLVPECKLESANGIIQAVQSLSGIIAPVLGGVLYGALGLTALVTISSAAFGLAALMEMFIKIPFVKRPQTGGIAATIIGDLKGGFVFILKEPLIRKLGVMAALLNLVITPCIVIAAPLIIRTTMNAGDTVYGAGMGVIELASILGALSVGIFTKRMRANNLWYLVALMAALFFPAALSVTQPALSLGFWPPFTLFMLCMVVMIAAAAILSIFVIVKVQAKTPSENLGKVMAILIAVSQCVTPIGQLVYGVAFEGFGGAEYVPLLLAGVISVLIALLGKTILKNEKFDNEKMGG